MTLKVCAITDQLYAKATGAGTSVVVIDSGVEGNHPDLHGTEVSGVVITERFGRFVVSEYDGVDVAGHGTACADRIRHMAPDARIISCRILNRTIQATSQALLVALDWVLEQPGIDVVNLSLGTPNRQFGLDIAERVDQLYARGLPVVVARGYEDRLDYPSAFGSPVSVAAERVDQDDALIYYPGSVVEFGARGYNVEVAWKGGTRINVNGSSFAAPLIAGRLARLKSIEPELKVWDLKSLLVGQSNTA